MKTSCSFRRSPLSRFSTWLSSVVKVTAVFAVLVAAPGCAFISTSQHAGIVTVPRPATTEQDANTWFMYYRDQFDAFEGAVLPPSAESPDVEKQAYQRAAGDYRARASRNAFLNPLIGGGILFVGIALLVAVISPSS